MKKILEIGSLIGHQGSHAAFTLPIEATVHTFGLIAIRGAGKTVLATVMAEEFCECGIPWVALDPVGVWWGLRCKPDGSPGGYPVVVFGGPHADLPLDRDGGARIADAILKENVPCIIDMSRESKNVWRHFTADFCDRLMEQAAPVPRHVFVEEAPEFVPQKPMGEQKRSLAAVDRLIRLGRNFGYGASILSQRYATVQKDCLTQCESLFALRSIGKPDRKAAADWISEVAEQDDPKRAERFVLSLTKLGDGEGWFWSPQWLDKFVHMQVRQRKTYHPGATRKMGQQIKQVDLLDVTGFVERFRELLSKAKKQDAATKARKTRTTPEEELAPALEVSAMEIKANKLQTMLDRALESNQRLMAENKEMKTRLDAVKTLYEPQYGVLQKLFSEIDQAAQATASIGSGAYAGWDERLGPGPMKILNALIERGGVATKVQLKTWVAMPRETFRVYMSKLTSNSLVKREGQSYRLTLQS